MITEKSLLQAHYENFPQMAIGDAVKFLYQRFMGPGHLVPEAAKGVARLREEWDAVDADDTLPLSTPLGNGLCRLHLRPCKGLGLSPNTVARLFLLTAQQFTPDPARLEQALNQVCSLPFPPGQAEEYVRQYREQGCPMVSHSEHFRACYSPAYRIVSEYYVSMIPLLAAIDRSTADFPQLRVAIDGPCASGKSTLGHALQEIYSCELIHMDDFFLRPEQRTHERLAQPGGNVDYERFSQEVLSPLLAHRPISYRPWSCSTQSFAPPVCIPPAPLTVVEGCYSLRDDLRHAYHLRVWAYADWNSRSRRLLGRGGEECLARFRQLWIPLEDRYFDHMQVQQCCQLRLDLSDKTAL